MRGLVVLACMVGCGRIAFAPTGTGSDGGGGPGGDGGDVDGFVRGDITFTTNVAFVTEQTVVPGALGSLAAADAVCQEEANAAGLAGTYVAWFSTSTTDAIDRLAGSRGWVRADGLPFIDEPTDIPSGVMSPLHVMASGVPISVANAIGVATGTTANGTVSSSLNCSDLTSTSDTTAVGAEIATSARWTTSTFAFAPCSSPLRLYCFGTGSTTALDVPPVSARQAFLSTTPWTPGAGIASADAVCQTDANSAGLSNAASFVALLATSTASAASRLSDGAPWARTDGVLVAPTTQAFVGGSWQVTLNVRADGSYNVAPSMEVRVGGATPDSIGETCADWSVANNGSTGTAHEFDSLSRLPTQHPCGGSMPLYCVEP